MKRPHLTLAKVDGIWKRDTCKNEFHVCPLPDQPAVLGVDWAKEDDRSVVVRQCLDCGRGWNLGQAHI